MISHQFMDYGNQWPRFSPDGELLSFASPKESNQRKGDPSSSPFGFPNRSERTGASPTRPNRLHKTQSVAELKHGYAFFPSAHFDSATQQGEPGVDPRAAKLWITVRENRWCIHWVPFYVAEKRSRTGRKGAACLSSAARGVLCPVSGRVAAPPRGASIAGKPKADIVGVAFLWLLSLAKQRK